MSFLSKTLSGYSPLTDFSISCRGRIYSTRDGFNESTPYIANYLLLILNAIFRDTFHKIRNSNLVLIDRRDACPTIFLKTWKSQPVTHYTLHITIKSSLKHL